jgi:hypothetical protein
MTRVCSTMILAAALLTLASPAVHAQTPAGSQLRAAPTLTGRAGAPAPARINLVNVENRLSDFGGLYIHMSVVEIDSVLSPRLFTVRRPLMPRHEAMDGDSKVLLLLDGPLPALTEGARVQVTGWVTTAPSASLIMGRDWGTTLDDDFFADTNRPLILANIVRSLDGAELVSRP